LSTLRRICELLEGVPVSQEMMGDGETPGRS